MNGPARRVCSVVVPVYRNEDTLADLLDRLGALAAALPVELRCVFVVDGSPDRSAEVLAKALDGWEVPSTLVVLSRNFGSFAAIRAGLARARGDYFAVMAADLQEPPELLVSFVELLERGDVDLVLGERTGRDDPLAARAGAAAFWGVYRRIVQPEMPPGGVDVFACNDAVRSAILAMHESNTSLVGQLLWIGFRRATVPYRRLARPSGRSAWTTRKKLRYMADSVFSFTDLPIRVLLAVGTLGTVLIPVIGAVVLAAWLLGAIDVPGYTPLMLAVLLVGGIVTLGLGVVGSYVWRTFENTKGRPLVIEQAVREFPGGRP